MKESLKPKNLDNAIDAVIKNMAEKKTVGKHRLNLSLPASLFDELKDLSDQKGLTVTAFLITLVNRALGKD